jgi:hypothetical protein
MVHSSARPLLAAHCSCVHECMMLLEMLAWSHMLLPRSFCTVLRLSWTTWPSSLSDLCVDTGGVCAAVRVTRLCVPPAGVCANALCGSAGGAQQQS